MSKLTWAALLFVGASVGLVAYLMTRPLSDYSIDSAAQVKSQITQRELAFTAAEAALDKAIAEDPDYLGAIPELTEARAALKAQAKGLAAARAEYDELVAPLVEANRHSDEPALMDAVTHVSAAAAEVTLPTPLPADLAEVYAAYKRDFDDLVATAEAQVQAAVADAGVADPLAAQLAAAAAECPEAAEALNKAYTGIQASRDRLLAWAPELAQRKAAQPRDPIGTGKLTQAISITDASRKAGRVILEASLGTLTQSQDVVLVDMKREGALYYHRYDTYTDGQVKNGEWQVVSPTTYRANESNLGMAISTKPECTLEADRVTVPSPPGYAYVGNPRYGKWETRGGDRFWVFYGQYALMRDVLWGRGYYRPVSYSSWGRYDTARRARQPWYGGSNEFGSRGSRTRTRYAGSSAVKRAQSPASSSSRTGYKGSNYQGTSGKRSGNYKTTPYRSRSFGGSGK